MCSTTQPSNFCEVRPPCLFMCVSKHQHYQANISLGRSLSNEYLGVGFFHESGICYVLRVPRLTHFRCCFSFIFQIYSSKGQTKLELRCLCWCVYVCTCCWNTFFRIYIFLYKQHLCEFQKLDADILRNLAHNQYFVGRETRKKQWDEIICN